jgi:hypothetical protein
MSLHEVALSDAIIVHAGQLYTLDGKPVVAPPTQSVAQRKLATGAQVITNADMSNRPHVMWTTGTAKGSDIFTK